MAQHGYLREFDEDRRSERGERAWRHEGHGGGDRFMFEDRDRESYADSHGRSSSHPDEYYRRWRDKQMQALDRDYEEYRREREREFHTDFEDWRRQRYSTQPLQTGMTQSSPSTDPSGTLELTNPTQAAEQDGPDPTANATLGTNSGRRRRR